MHATLEKFGYPTNRLLETEYWCVLLRPVQVTLGSIVLGHKSAAVRSIAEIPSAHFIEFRAICQSIESSIREELGAEKFNYLALMMVDPHFHFHVLPRYGSSIRFLGQIFRDDCWPGPPELSSKQCVTSEVFTQLRQLLAVSISESFAGESLQGRAFFAGDDFPSKS